MITGPTHSRKRFTKHQQPWPSSCGRLWPRLHVAVTTAPTADWIARQASEADRETAPGYLIKDCAGAYGDAIKRRLKAMGIRDCPTTPRSPWQKACVSYRTYYEWRTAGGYGTPVPGSSGFSLTSPGRSAPSQCEIVAGPSFSSPNQPERERTTAYRDSSVPLHVNAKLIFEANKFQS